MNRRSLMDLGMGIIYAVMGLFFGFSGFFGFDMEFPPKSILIYIRWPLPSLRRFQDLQRSKEKLF